MTIFLQVVGAMVMALLCAAVAFAALAFFLDRIESYQTRRDAKLEELTIRRLGRSIKGAAWWFSEDVTAMTALQILGEELCDNGGDIGRTVDELRRRWRERNECAEGENNAGS